MADGRGHIARCELIMAEDSFTSSRPSGGQAMTGQIFFAGAHDRVLKVARTLADLEGSEHIASNHVLEAINYRTLARAMWA